MKPCWECGNEEIKYCTAIDGFGREWARFECRDCGATTEWTLSEEKLAETKWDEQALLEEERLK